MDLLSPGDEAVNAFPFIKWKKTPPCGAELCHKSHAPDEGLPHKCYVTLFWNANTPRRPLAHSQAFGFGESLTWVGS